MPTKPQTPEQKVDAIYVALVGNPLDPNGEPGLIQVVKRHEAILYGTEDDPGGIVADWRRGQKFFWTIGGVALVISLVWAVFWKFYK